MVPKIILAGLCLLLLFIPFNEGGGSSTALFVTQTLVLFLITLQVFHSMNRAEGKFSHSPILANYLLPFVFVLWSFSSLFISKYIYTSLLELTKLLSYLAVFILCRGMQHRKNYQNILLLTLLLSIHLQAILALYHYYLTPFGQLRSGFININDFATFLGVGFALLGAWSLKSGTWGRGGVIPPLHASSFLLLAPCFFLGWMILVTGSRGGLLSLGIALAGLFYFSLRRVFYIVLVALIILTLVPNPWRTQVLQWKQEDPFAYDRIQIWKSSLSMIRDHPLFGVGLGMYGEYFEQYRFPTENWIARYQKTTDLAHNEFLQVGAELGIPGLLLAVILTAYLFLSGIWQIRIASQRNKGTAHHISTLFTPLGLLISLLVIFIQSLVNSVLHSPAIAITTTVLAALLLNQNQGSVSPLPPFSHSSARRIIFTSLLSIYLWIVVILYPFLGHFHYLKAQTLLDEDKPLEAVENLNQALAYIPLQPYYHSSLGNLYTIAFRNQPNWEAFYGGIKEFSEAIRWNPREPQFYHDRATLHIELFRRLLPTEQTLSNGIADYQKAIALSPFDPFLRYNLALVYFNTKRYAEAREQLEKALDLEPNFIGGYYLLSKVLASFGEGEASDEKLRRARELAKQFNPQSYDSLYLKNLFQRPIPNF